MYISIDVYISIYLKLYNVYLSVSRYHCLSVDTIEVMEAGLDVYLSVSRYHCLSVDTIEVIEAGLDVYLSVSRYHCL